MNRARGRPPRAWRTAGGLGPLGARRRKTATCVENRPPGSSRPCSPPEDLHVRGEQDVGPVWGDEIDGRPPRAWRTAAGWRPKSPGVRKTSTCVENSGAGRGTPGLGTEDLHVRGEQRVAALPR